MTQTTWNTSTGIHHITALARDPKVNIDFYTRVLGLRKVKVSVNQDDPETYHLYYGNRIGEPGTALTFFPHPEARDGRAGRGQATEVRFEIAKSSIGFWLDRLATLNIAADRVQNEFDTHVIRFKDPDFMDLELVGVDNPYEGHLWGTDDIPTEHAIRGFHSALIWAGENVNETIALLKDLFEFKNSETKGQVTRLSTGNAGLAQIIDVYHEPDPRIPRGMMGAGAIHHIAFRAGSSEQEEHMRDVLMDQHYNVTPVIDRYYFQSVYFREPTGVIFEIATDAPGFTVDELEETLGTELKLPPHLEDQRQEIESKLVPIA